MSENKPLHPSVEQQGTEVTEAQIAVHWPEEAYFSPLIKFIAQANLTDASIFERFSLDKVPECYKEFGDLLDRKSVV